MAITVLNNISDLVAENAVSSTQASLQKVLQQLSTGLKINNGSDDAAGLAIVDGINSNVAALTQSVQNSNNGVGLLQTADGALSQVTTLLDRAVTIATEGSTSVINTNQYGALNTEFQSILSEISQIGNATNFNGNNVFTSNAVTSYESTTGASGTASLTTATALAIGDTINIIDSGTGKTFTFTATSGQTVGALNSAIAAAVTAGTLSTGVTGAIDATTGQEQVSQAATGAGLVVTTSAAALGQFAPTINNHTTVYVGDGTTAPGVNTNVTTQIGVLSSAALKLSGNSLTDVTTSQAALSSLNSAINSIANERGNIGASVNRLTAVSNVISAQVTNLQSAANGLQNADIGVTVANLTQYNVLQSTGIAALQQANQAQQTVLKLVQ